MMTTPPTTAETRTIVFITGASQGLGLQIARILSTPALHPGYHVIIGALTRREGSTAVSLLLAEDPSRCVSSMAMDVTSDASIAAAVESTATGFGYVSVLINNAGLLLDDLNDAVTSRALYEQTFGVNVFGAAAVTDAFAPLLARSPSVLSPPRVVFMSSRLGSLAVNARTDAADPASQRWFPAYRSSKCALNMLMLHYARRFRREGWKVNATDPGLSRTAMTAAQDDAIKGSVEQGARNAIRLAVLGEDGETGTFTNVGGVVEW